MWMLQKDPVFKTPKEVHLCQRASLDSPFHKYPSLWKEKDRREYEIGRAVSLRDNL